MWSWGACLSLDSQIWGAGLFFWVNLLNAGENFRVQLLYFPDWVLYDVKDGAVYRVEH